MDIDNKTYCRFCADPKGPYEIIYLSADAKKIEEIVFKLAFLNAMYVDIYTSKNLPKTICFECNKSLNSAYEFLNKVKKSQELLLYLITTKESKHDVSDDERSYDDLVYTNSEINSAPTIKLESSGAECTDLDACNNTCDVTLKEELKEEIDATIIEDRRVGSQSDQTLNVQDILDAAMCKIPFTAEDVEIYAKEVPAIEKKSITQWKDYPWICEYCDIEFLDLNTLRAHAKLTHGKCNAFTCIDCENYNKSEFKLFLKHVRRHRRKLRARCHYCDNEIDEEDMDSHILSHFKPCEVPCPSCGEILQNDDALQKHITQYDLTKPKRKPQRKRGTPITEAELTCNFCKKLYKNPNSLRDHIRNQHETERKRNFACDRCGKMYYNKGTLTSHIMRSHEHIHPHTCKICNRSFLFPNMLRRHVDMHYGVKPFSCEQCGRCFRLQYQLTAHKIIHTDLKPYTCQYCNKTFRFKQILNNHLLQHTGAKPYSCQICGMDFTNWSNYNKHMKRRHATDTSKKKITPDGVFRINPKTGEMLKPDDPGTEEWKTKIMVPGKRGKKKVKKQEDAS